MSMKKASGSKVGTGKQTLNVSEVNVRNHGGVVSTGNGIPLDTELFGLFFMELDMVDGRDSYVVAYGCPKKVQTYKEQVRGKGTVKVYKSQRWLVKRLETLKEMYGNHLTFLYLK